MVGLQNHQRVHHAQVQRRKLLPCDHPQHHLGVGLAGLRAVVRAPGRRLRDHADKVADLRDESDAARLDGAHLALEVVVLRAEGRRGCLQREHRVRDRRGRPGDLDKRRRERAVRFHLSADLRNAGVVGQLAVVDEGDDFLERVLGACDVFDGIATIGEAAGRALNKREGGFGNRNSLEPGTEGRLARRHVTPPMCA